MKTLSLALVAVLIASAAFAASSGTSTIQQRGTVAPPMGNQTSTGTGAKTTTPAAETTIADLLSKGYTIRAAVPNGGKFIVFMQKDQSAYACEFQSLTGARCGAIN